MDQLWLVFLKAYWVLWMSFCFCSRHKNGLREVRAQITFKPVMMAKINSLVAFGVKYYALVNLHNIDKIRLWEPATVYF